MSCQIRSVRTRAGEPFIQFRTRFGLTEGTGEDEWYSKDNLFHCNNTNLSKPLRSYLHVSGIPYQERISSDDSPTFRVISYLGDLDYGMTRTFPMMLNEEGVEVYGPQGSKITDPERWLKYLPELDTQDRDSLFMIDLVFNPKPDDGWSLI